MSRSKLRLKLTVPIAIVAATGLSILFVSRATGSAPPPYDSYAAKFACGEFGKALQPSPAATVEGPVKPGNYQTVINVHNPNAAVSVGFVKKAVLLFAGANPVAATVFEVPKPPGNQRVVSLPPDHGMYIDCQDIRKFLLPPPGSPPAPTFIEGWVVIQVPVPTGATAPPPLDVTAMYTSFGFNCVSAASCATVTREGFSQEVLTIEAKRITK